MLHAFKDLLKFDMNIPRLGEATYDSPLNLSERYGDNIANYVSDDDRVYSINLKSEFNELDNDINNIPTFEKAGPRKKIYFQPGETRSAVVTCGGLCPGLNAVIRAIVRMNYYRYGNKITYGIKNGYRGFIDKYELPIVNLMPEDVEPIHKMGGTILGSSRGPQDEGEIVDKLVELGVSVLYTIGGDGTLRGALDLYNEIKKRNLKISVIGIPKTIDNDIAFIDRSFGFETAFSKACEAIEAAHVEAKGAYNGIGLVKVMGRHSGFIAANTTIASNDVNFTLIPEIPFELDGPKGFLNVLKKRILRSRHAVILVAEGAGQQFFTSDNDVDASGNKKLDDIGLFLKQKIKEYFAAENIKTSVKYIDPSYIIRSMPPTPNDSIFCLQLAQNAVHAAMSGRTAVVMGYYNGEFIHIPVDAATSRRKVIDPESELWLSVLEETDQPISFIND